MIENVVTSLEDKILSTSHRDIIALIRSIFNVPTGSIPLHAPVFDGNEKKYLEECIHSTLVSSVGKFVNLFEESVSEFTGARKAVVCVNGTSALFLALKLVGLKEDEEALTQSVSFVATANAITYCGAKPVFLDVDRDTMGMSPLALEKFLMEETRKKNGECYNKKTGKRIRVCVPMHTFGHPCRIDKIASLCNEYGIVLIEDAAESIGSYYKNIHTGTFGKIGIISFNGNKTITTGGGGIMLFNDEILAERAKYLSTQAKVPHQWDFFHDEIGYNYRMPNVNAAIGLAQMENLKFYLSRKRLLASKYKDFFKNSSVKFFIEPENCSSNYWLNAIIFNSRTERDLFLKQSNGEGIMTRPLWILTNKLPMYDHCQRDSLENSLWLEERVVAIPSSVIL
jgi:aminotransferase in exopolysaccharide biosynthesis